MGNKEYISFQFQWTCKVKEWFILIRQKHEIISPKKIMFVTYVHMATEKHKSCVKVSETDICTISVYLVLIQQLGRTYFDYANLFVKYFWHETCILMIPPSLPNLLPPLHFLPSLFFSVLKLLKLILQTDLLIVLEMLTCIYCMCKWILSS